MEIAAGYFPDYPVQPDINIRRRYKTSVWESITGKEIRRRLFPVRESTGTGHKGGYGYFSVSSIGYTPAQRQAVADFLDSMDGAFKAFYFFRRDFANFSNYYVGDVSGSSSIIIPFKDAEVSLVTVENVSKTFTLTQNAGVGGETRINFLTGAQTGPVRVDCYGRERWLVRAVNDEVVESFIANIVKDNAVVTLEFKQVR